MPSCRSRLPCRVKDTDVVGDGNTGASQSSLPAARSSPAATTVPPADPVIEVFEAEIPAEMRTEAAHQRKANKYVHFLTDIHDNSMNGEPWLDQSGASMC